MDFGSWEMDIDNRTMGFDAGVMHFDGETRF